jgi:hypothetical protein
VAAVRSHHHPPRMLSMRLLPQFRVACPSGQPRMARRWFSNWLVTQPSCGRAGSTQRAARESAQQQGAAWRARWERDWGGCHPRIW